MSETVITTTTEAVSTAPQPSQATSVPETSSQPVQEQIKGSTEGSILGDTPTPWYDSNLATEYPHLKDFKSLDEFVKSDHNARKLLGKRVQELSPDEVKSFMSQEELAEVVRPKDMPTKIEDYNLNLGIAMPEAEVNKLKERFFQNNITPKQAEELVKFSQESQAQALEQTKAMWLDETAKRFGSNATATVDMAKRAVAEFASPEIKKIFDTTGIGNNPDVIQFLANIGKAMVDHRVPHTATHSDGGASLDAVKSEIAAKLKDPKFYRAWQEQHPGAVGEINALYRKQYELEGK